MVSAITDRAAAFLDMRFLGAHKSKRVAQVFEVSPEMAKLLRRGEGWTAQRIGQAAKLFGRDFVQFVFQDVMGPERPYEPDPELVALKGRMARLEARVGGGDDGSAPSAGMARQEVKGSVDGEGRAGADKGGEVGPTPRPLANGSER